MHSSHLIAHAGEAKAKRGFLEGVYLSWTVPSLSLDLGFYSLYELLVIKTGSISWIELPENSSGRAMRGCRSINNGTI